MRLAIQMLICWLYLFSLLPLKIGQVDIHLLGKAKSALNVIQKC